MKWDDTNILDPEEVEAARNEMSEPEFDQEFNCSWSAAIRGAYYAKEMDLAMVGSVPHDKALRVITSWDLGMADSTAIWFWQIAGSEIRAIDYMEFQGMGLPDIVAKLQTQPYNYIQHILPHDVKVRELGTGKSREEVLKSLGVNPTIAPNQSIADGINALRNMISRMCFDEDKCKQGIEALRQYRTSFDDKRQVFRNAPLHNWCSHAADSARYFAITKVKTVEYQWDDWSESVNV